MLHIPCDADRSSFASLVAVLQATGNASFVRKLSSEGIKSARDLENAPRSRIRGLIGDVAMDRLFQSQPARAQVRGDIPEVHPYARGSLQRIGLAPGPENDRVVVDLERADREFLQDRSAKSSQAPRESRWVTWALMAAKRHGAAPGDRRANFRDWLFDESWAVPLCCPIFHIWPQQLDLARAQAVRSITRGLGPAAAKLNISFDHVRLDFPSVLSKAYTDLEVPVPLRVREPFATAITAVWFLLRGIEVAGIKGEDVRFNRSEKAVTVRLPVSKTDLEGKGCERRHVCICSLVHDQGCPRSDDLATMFTALQKCKCSSGRHPLCVFHALLEMVVRRRKEGSYDPSQPLFGDGQVAVTQRQLTQLARTCAFVLQQETLFEWSPAVLDKWSQHCFRVSGAQLFARAGVPCRSFE